MEGKNEKRDNDGFSIEDVSIEDGVVVIHRDDVLITVNTVRSGIEVCRCDTKAIPLLLGGVILKSGGRVEQTAPRRVR